MPPDALPDAEHLRRARGRFNTNTFNGAREGAERAQTLC